MTEKKAPYRPEKYKKEFAEQAAKLCALGAIDNDLADFFNVCPKTIHNWREKHKEFKEAIKEAKEELDAKVVRSLYERAVGYSHDDVHITAYEGNPIITPITKHYAPETKAAIFWLKNRMPDDWRDQQHVDVKSSQTVRTLSEGRERAQNREKPSD